MSGVVNGVPIILHHTDDATHVPDPLYAGETAWCVAPAATKVWVGEGPPGNVNRLLLSTNTADLPVFAIPSGGPFVPVAGGTTDWLNVGALLGPLLPIGVASSYIDSVAQNMPAAATNTNSITMSTTEADCVVVLWVLCNVVPNLPTSASLTWARRGAQTGIAIYEYWARTTAALANEVITITQSGSNVMTMLAVAYTGIDATPWATVTSPVLPSGNAGAAISVVTANRGALIIGCGRATTLSAGTAANPWYAAFTGTDGYLRDLNYVLADPGTISVPVQTVGTNYGLVDVLQIDTSARGPVTPTDSGDIDIAGQYLINGVPLANIQDATGPGNYLRTAAGNWIDGLPLTGGTLNTTSATDRTLTITATGGNQPLYVSNAGTSANAAVRIDQNSTAAVGGLVVQMTNPGPAKGIVITSAFSANSGNHLEIGRTGVGTGLYIWTPAGVGGEEVIIDHAGNGPTGLRLEARTTTGIRINAYPASVFGLNIMPVTAGTVTALNVGVAALGFRVDVNGDSAGAEYATLYYKNLAVQWGAADSGGTGFRALVTPN